MILLKTLVHTIIIYISSPVFNIRKEQFQLHDFFIIISHNSVIINTPKNIFTCNQVINKCNIASIIFIKQVLRPLEEYEAETFNLTHNIWFPKVVTERCDRKLLCVNI